MSAERLVSAVDLGGSMAHDMSVWGLFLQADLIIKAIMLLLLVSSVWSWAIIFDKITTLKKLSFQATRFENSFWSGEALEKLYQRLEKAATDPMARVFCAGMNEWKLSNSGEGENDLGASLPQRIDRAMATMINREIGKLEKYMTFLATVGSTAPFVGLLGTVWGIMNSFTAISGSQNTSLAVVAPGIAEALSATALGLVAAIPAVVAYNKFSTDIGRYADRMDAFSSEFSAILGRHFEQKKR